MGVKPNSGMHERHRGRAYRISCESEAKRRVLLHHSAYCLAQGAYLKATVKQQGFLEEDCWGSKAVQERRFLLL